VRVDFGWLNSGMQTKAREGFLLFFQVFLFASQQSKRGSNVTTWPVRFASHYLKGNLRRQGKGT
jgi:hypothetical protein